MAGWVFSSAHDAFKPFVMRLTQRTMALTFLPSSLSILIPMRFCLAGRDDPGVRGLWPGLTLTSTDAWAADVGKEAGRSLIARFAEQEPK